MSCISATLLQRFLADRLSVSDEERVALHLTDCRDCRRLAELLCADPDVQRDLDGHRDGSASEGLFESLRKKLYHLTPVSSASVNDSAAEQGDEHGVEAGPSGAAETGDFTGPGGTVSPERPSLPVSGQETVSAPRPVSDSELQAKQWIERELAAAETTVLHLDSPLEPRQDPPLIHDRLQFVGRFHLQRRLGLGGFGVVYLAYDTVLKRQVALKLPRSIALLDPDLRRRFLREGEAVASLYHQNIVPVFEAGEVHGLCFIATAYCPGPTLAAWLNDMPQRAGVELTSAVSIMIDLAEAVEHAHQAGILHRDIKPGNVLLDPTHPSQDLPFTPKLTDFGLAKTIDCEAHRTSTGTMMGTPQYMAPEQASGCHDQVGPATDVYSLGVVLYEMLTGQLPIAGTDSADTLRRLLVEEPPRVRRRARHVPEDLEAVCMKCLEKRPHRRYRSAQEVAEDLRRFRDGEPTIARPDTPLAACRRWVRRHPAQARYLAAAGMSVVLLLLGMWFHLSQLQEVNQALEQALNDTQRAHVRAVQSERHAQQLLYATDIAAAAQAWRDGDFGQMDLLLARHRVTDGVDQRGFEWRYLSGLARNSFTRVVRQLGSAYHVTFSPDANWLAIAGQDGMVRVYDVRRGVIEVEFAARQSELNSLAFSRDGRRLAAAGDDGSVAVWDWQRGEELARESVSKGLAFVVLFLEEDRRLAVCSSDTTIRILDAVTCRELQCLKDHTAPVESLAVDPTGTLLASAGDDQLVLLWSLPDYRLVGTLRHASKVMNVAFSPDGRYLASATLDGTASLWDPRSSELLHEFRHLDSVQSLAFSADSRQLAVGDRGGVIRWWPVEIQDVERAVWREQRKPWKAHQGRVYSLAVDPRFGRLVSAGQDGEVRIWNEAAFKARRVFNGNAQTEISDIAFTPDSNSLLAVGPSGLQRWSLGTGEAHTLDHVRRGEPVLLVSQADWYALGDKSGKVSRHRLIDGKMIATWNSGESGAVRTLLTAGRKRLLALLSHENDELIQFYELDGTLAFEIPADPRCQTAAISPDGNLLAVDSLNDVVVWKLAPRLRAQRLKGHHSTIQSIAFSPGSHWIATGSKDRYIRLWDAGTGHEVATLAGLREEVTRLRFTRDGRTLISADRGGSVRLWHVATGQQLCELDDDSGAIVRLLVSPDGRRIAYLNNRSRIVLLSFNDA